MRDDAERWNGRYEGRRPGEPSAPKGLTPSVVPNGGRCVDVACGLGEQTLWAARLGFDVVALDVSDRAIELLRAQAQRVALDGRVDARVCDLDTGVPAELSGTASLVICQRFRDPSLSDALVDLLAPDGVLVITVLSAVGLGTEPGPFHAPAGELLDVFSRDDVEILHHEERNGEATLLARRCSNG